MTNFSLTTPVDNEPVAILYQALPPPVIDGISKPIKPGGYSDSGADIAFALQRAGVRVVTPVTEPNASQPFDWVFADTREGIAKAVSLGGRVLWMNTVLFNTHPVEAFIEQGGWVVGQDPTGVAKYDDKWFTNSLLKRSGLPTPEAITVKASDLTNLSTVVTKNFTFPLIVKPIRGRGSTGVVLAESDQQLRGLLIDLMASRDYGDTLMVEEYLPGEELTITSMPPGNYWLAGKKQYFGTYWSLPPVKRFNHQGGVAPYNGSVAVLANSFVLTESELALPAIQLLMQQCAQAAQLVAAKAPIRIDCRQNKAGQYYLFDLNMKPNMTGAGRPGRADQDSLTVLAADGIGWTYTDLLLNMLHHAWRQS